MCEKKGKLQTLEEALFPLTTEYQGKMRYLVLLLQMLVLAIMTSILYWVRSYVSYQTFRHIGATVLLSLLLVWYLSVRHRRKNERKES